LSALSCFPRYEHEILLLLHVFARPLHAVVRPLLTVAPVLPFRRLPVYVFALVLPAHLLLEAAAQDARNLIPALRTFCRCGFVILNCEEDAWRAIIN
jgi:hypothetical protein